MANRTEELRLYKIALDAIEDCYTQGKAGQEPHGAAKIAFDSGMTLPKYYYERGVKGLPMRKTPEEFAQ